MDDGRTDDGRRTDGRTTEHGYTISSPCEPDGSGELKMTQYKKHDNFDVNQDIQFIVTKIGHALDLN